MNAIDRDAVIEEMAVAAWAFYADTCKRLGLNPHQHGEWIASNYLRALKSQPAQPCSKPNALQVAFEKIHGIYGLTQPDQRDEALNLAREALALAKSIIGHPDDCGSKFIAEALSAIDALKGKQ